MPRRSMVFVRRAAAVQRARYMTPETIAGQSDDLVIRLPDVVI